MSFDEPDGYGDDLARTRDDGPRYPSSASTDSEYDDYDDPDGSGLSANEPTTPLPTRGRPAPPPEEPSEWRRRGGRVWRFTRTLAFTVLVLVGLAAIGDVLINHYPRTSRHTYRYNNVQQMVVAIDGNGAITVHGADTDEVTVKAVDRATLLDPVERQIISSGGRLIVSVHCPNSECSSKYDIEVPRSMSVDAMIDHSSDQADLTATGLSAAVRLFTGRGNVTVDHLATTSDVSVTANGQVHATDVSAANLSCVPAGHCTGANGDITQDTVSAVHEDPNSTHNIQVNVVQNTAKIQAG